MSQETLQREIIARSKADDWRQARGEWRLKRIWMNEEAQRCLCGHFPIREVCVVHNKENGATTEVGNCCVNHFLHLNSNKLFSSVRRVAADIEASFNAATIKMARDEGIIDDWKRDFYLDVWRKQNLTERQLAKKRQINRAIIRAITRKAKTGS